MSVDIEELAAHLNGKRQADVQEQYHARATHATTAFLLCFFMGYLGAHRFYLGQWRSGLSHLAVFALGVASLAGGYLSGSPINAALYVTGGLLILVSLIWEVIDLGRIDDEIHQRNLLMAEGLIAGALLSDHSAVDSVTSKLDEVVHTAAAQSREAGALPAPGGAISLAELAHARDLAEQSGHASISYEAMSTFNVSATPEERQGEHPVFEPATTTERRVNTEPLPNSPDGEQAIEAETHTHSVDGYHVTDAIETDRVSGPSAGAALGLGAAALGAAGLGYGLSEAAHAHEAPYDLAEAASVEPTPIDPFAAPVSELAAPEMAPAISDRYEIPTEAPQLEPYGDTAPLAPVISEPAAYAAPEAPHAGADVTDAGAPNFMEPASDVAFASAYPSFVTLPEQSAAPFATEDVTQPDIPLYFTGDETPAESYAPPVPDFYGAEPAPSSAAPVWDAPPEPVAPAEEPNRLAEVAGFGALAGAGALAADAWAHHDHTPDEPGAEAVPAAESTHAAAEPIAAPVEAAAPKMKRIRVKHRIVVEGQVVREEVVEREIPADADMAEAARQIQMEWEQGPTTSTDEIARLANLSSDEQVEVRRRVDGLAE